MVTIETSKCIGCGRCANDCITENIKLQEGKAACGGPCILCGHCVAVCPANAVSIPEYEMADVEPCGKDRVGLDMDQLLHTIKARRSIRRYTEQPVEREKLERIVQAGRYTATGSNRQACRFIVVQDGLSVLKELVWAGVAASNETSDAVSAKRLFSLRRFMDMRARGIDYLFRNAPAVLYIAADSTVDAALAAQNVELAAVSQGLGVMYNGFLIHATAMSPAACEWLNAQDKPLAVCMLMGYPQVTYMRTAPRRAADVRWL